MNNIEKYVADEMTAEERAAFEAELERNPALAEEVNFMRQLTEDIEMAALAERVKEALHELPPARPKWPKYPWWPALVLAGLLAVALLYFQKEGAPPPPEAIPPVEMPPVDPLKQAPTKAEAGQPSSQETAEEKTTGRPGGPIAQQQPDENAYTPIPAPQLRGSGSSTDTARQALLDAVWYSVYPPEGLQVSEPFRQVDELLQQGEFSKSYARLQLLERKMPTNDTLFFLKGYCLLERGEGDEALRYFGQIKNQNLAGTGLLEWYRGLAFLLSGDDGSAKKTFADISASPAHAFRRQAKRALTMME
ncbi:MAG: hypothetical protein KDC66_19145 [Phaeodactylibacter sp.]|nr:hypothetical protein [Phaeodactylibacter sp.]MCB9273484.1 hypothetical protein [Lewinellaceae bacterium]